MSLPCVAYHCGLKKWQTIHDSLKILKIFIFTDTGSSITNTKNEWDEWFSHCISRSWVVNDKYKVNKGKLIIYKVIAWFTCRFILINYIKKF